MLNRIIEWSLRHRLIVIGLTVALIAVGLRAATLLDIDAFPDTTPIQVQINTNAATLTPAEIEAQITAPIERAIGGLPRLELVRSISKFGLSQVTVIFEEGADVYFARQLLSERLTTVELPQGIERPRLGPVATGLGEIYHYIVSSRTRSLAELRTIQDWTIRPQLRDVKGVAEVNSWGGLERQFQVVVDPLRLMKHSLTLADVIEALRRGNANVGGGAISRAGENILVQGIGLVTTTHEIGGIVITAKDGVPIYVRDVAEVVDGHEIRRGATTCQGRGECVLGLVFMLMGENSHAVARRVSERMAQIRASLPPDVDVTTVYDRTKLIDHVLSTVKRNLFEGALLVVAVLFAFLGQLRAGLIVALAIPLSMLVAGSLMVRFGIAATLMSLGAIDFGLVVDSSVIMVENSVRRLRESSMDRSRLEIVRDAAIEVRRPTMFGELIIMIVYLPILLLEGIEGKMFRPMALTVLFALAGSLVFSLTLMPVLSSLLLPRTAQHREPLLIRIFKRAYEPFLSMVLRRRGAVLAAAALMLLAAGLLAPRLGSEFVPRLSEESIVINTVRLASVSAEESVRYGTQIEKLLLSGFPDEIEHLWTRTGTAEVATDPMGLEVSDVFLTLKPRNGWTRARTQSELVQAIDAAMRGLPGMRWSFSQPIEMRFNEMIAGIRTELGVKIFGDDFDQLKTLAGRVQDVLRSIPGCEDVVAEQVTGQPVLEIRLRPDQLARFGIPAREVLYYIEAVGNIRVGEIRQGQVRFPLTVRLPEECRHDPERVAALLVPTVAGQRLPLGQLADLRIVDAPSTIKREWGRRCMIVQCNVRGRDVGGFVNEAQRLIAARIAVPPGYSIRYGGQFEHLERAVTRLMWVVPTALALVYLLLYLTYRRAADVARIFITLPLAAVGGIVALWLRGMPFSISAGVGFIAMSGVSVLGDMVFVSHLRRLVRDGMTLAEAVRASALTRLRPVLMTGLVASLGFLPMALSTGVGAEVQRPLATVVIGSVLTSTLLTLLVLPVLYSIVGSRRSNAVQ